MEFKTIVTVPVEGTVKASKPVGRQTLFVTDHVEIGTEKAAKATVRGSKYVASKTVKGAKRTKIAWKQHRTNLAARRELRVMVAEQIAHNKALAAENETAVDNGPEAAIA